MSGANASPTGRSHQEMTAHNPSIEFVLGDKACAVIDRAYSRNTPQSSVACPKLLLFRVTFEGQRHQTVEKLRIGHSACGPELGILADGCESRQRIDFVNEVF